jgi:hypothetical protein
MDGKRKSKGRTGLLDRAQAALGKKFVTKRQDDVLFVGSDGLLASKRGVNHLRLRFWTGAQKEYREALVKALDKSKIPYEVGPEYEIEQKGRRLDPKPALALMGAADMDTIGRIERTEHVRSCILCKELLDQAGTGDVEYQQGVYAVVLGHIKQNVKTDASTPKCPQPTVAAPACQYAGCVHHEDIDRELALAMTRICKGGNPWKDTRGVPVATIPLLADKEDHPEGWNFKHQDAESRRFSELFVDEAGCVYIRLAPKRVTLHVWIEPQYASKREDIEDPATIEDVLETWAKKVPALRDWCMRKYAEFKGLAEMDLDLGPPKK